MHIWVPGRMVQFSMTLSAPWPGFQGHGILTTRISKKRCVLGTKLLKNTNWKLYTIYRMEPLSMTLSDFWPRFQGHDIFRHWISQKRHEIEPYSYYGTSIWSRMRSIAWWHSSDLDGPLTRFSRSRHFWSRISQKRCILGTMLLKNMKPYTIYRMEPRTFNDLEWLLTPISRSRHFWGWIS